MLWRLRHGLETKIARCFASVGPYMPLSNNFAIGDFLRDDISGGPIQVRGDGTPVRSYLYAADLMIWLWTILFRGEPCRPYNVGSESALTVLETALEISSSSHPKVPVRVRQKRRKESTSGRYVPSTARARHELTLAQHVTLDQAIQQTSEWLRENRPRRENN